MPRPILFLDIDGVLAPFHGSTLTRFNEPLRIHWLPGLIQPLARLFEVFQPFWASWWQDESWEVGDLYEVPPTGFCNFSDYIGDFGPDSCPFDWKIPAMDTVAAGRPFAWIDDDITPYAFDWARARNYTYPTKFFRTDALEGLTEGLIDEVWEWACKLTPAMLGS